jgi:hypothetical protein
MYLMTLVTDVTSFHIIPSCKHILWNAYNQYISIFNVYVVAAYTRNLNTDGNLSFVCGASIRYMLHVLYC